MDRPWNSTRVTHPTSCRLCPHPQLWCSSWGKKHLLSSLQLRGLLLASLTSPQRKGPWVWPVQCLQARTVSPWRSGMGRSLLFPASVRLEGLRPRPLNTAQGPGRGSRVWSAIGTEREVKRFSPRSPCVSAFHPLPAPHHSRARRAVPSGAPRGEKRHGRKMSGAEKELLLPCRGLGVGGYRGGWA